MENNMKNPKAEMILENHNKIVIELFPKLAPNTVNSFIWAAKKGIFDNHCIERIVPDDWIDVSYTGFRKREGQYLIPYEYQLHPEIEPVVSKFGDICMGGYGELGQAGCEFFFPLRRCPEHRGIYPVFGKVISGEEELLRIKSLELEPVYSYPDPNIEVNRPLEAQRIITVNIFTYDTEYPEPICIDTQTYPKCWQQVWE